ncbi:MAG: MBL fold metallo-hydrolase [Verrucomicrobiota bacterium]
MILYDEPQDVVAKAMRGLGIPSDRIHAVPQVELASFLAGNFDPELARQIAPALGLAPEALATLPSYRPAPEPPAGVSRIEVPFDDETVNIWLIEVEDTVIVIDAGTRPDDLARLLAARGMDPVHLLITHEHRDHVGGIAAAKGRIASLHARSRFDLDESANEVDPGGSFALGPLTIEVFELRGHHPRALGYQIQGSGLNLLAVGDAIFAGSLGGCPDPEAFRTARRTIEALIDHRDPDTFLLTGHGAGTSLASELVANPFLAAWSRS